MLSSTCRNSAVGLAIAQVAHEKDKPSRSTGAGSADLTRQALRADLRALDVRHLDVSRSNGRGAQAGRKKWYFITADYAFGHALQRDATMFIEQAGGQVVGSAASDALHRVPAGGGLRQRRRRTAINCIKQAREFGLAGKNIALAAMLMFISDVHGAGAGDRAGPMRRSTGTSTTHARLHQANCGQPAGRPAA